MIFSSDNILLKKRIFKIVLYKKQGYQNKKSRNCISLHTCYIITVCARFNACFSTLTQVLSLLKLTASYFNQIFACGNINILSERKRKRDNENNYDFTQNFSLFQDNCRCR